MAIQQEEYRLSFPDAPDSPNSYLSYGLAFHEACAKHIQNTFGSTRAYIIASKSLSEYTPYLHQLQTSLGKSLAGTWIGIPNHTPADSLIDIVADVRAKSADAIITLGGGSVSDGAKLISLALANDVCSVEDLYKLPVATRDLNAKKNDSECKPPTVPVICIPISLSGGEYSRYSGVTDPKTHFKHQFTHPQLFPRLVILDPHITVSTPSPLWLSSGIRAIDHCVEGFLSIASTPAGDHAAKSGLVQLVKGLLKTKNDPNDVEARLSCMLGSNLSMELLAMSIFKGASHGIGHQLGAMGVGHGDTSCILLPAVCKWNAAVNGAKQEELKNVLMQVEEAKDLVERGKIGEHGDLGDVIRAIFDELGAPKTLKDVNFVEEDRIEHLAANCLNEVYVKTNPRPMKTKADVMEVIEMVRG